MKRPFIVKPTKQLPDHIDLNTEDHWDDRPDDPVGVFRGLANVLYFYALLAVAGYAIYLFTELWRAMQ